MKRLGIACALLIALTSAGLHAAEGGSAMPQYTHSQIKRMAREAHTPEQFSMLADYYATQQRMYAAKAVEMMHLWAQRNETYYRVEKWPRPVDSARNLHDYYEYKANQAAKLQAMYGRRADELAEK